MDDTKEKSVYYLCKEKYNLSVLSPSECMEELKDMEVRDEDIFIVGYPKSGTHWMQEIIHLILRNGNPQTMTKYDRKLAMELIDNTQDVALGDTPSGIPNFKRMTDDPSPRVFTTHLRYELIPTQLREKRCPIIYVSRHPKDVITSWYDFSQRILLEYFLVKDLPKYATDFDVFLKEKLEGKCEYDVWFDHVAEYDRIRDTENILYVSYEEMSTNLRTVVEKLAGFINKLLTVDQIESVVKNATFSTMKSNFTACQEETSDDHLIDITTMMWKGVTGRWKDLFTVRQSEKFNAAFGQRMKECELTKDYEL